MHKKILGHRLLDTFATDSEVHRDSAATRRLAATYVRIEQLTRLSSVDASIDMTISAL